MSTKVYSFDEMIEYLTIKINNKTKCNNEVEIDTDIKVYSINGNEIEIDVDDSSIALYDIAIFGKRKEIIWSPQCHWQFYMREKDIVKTVFCISQFKRLGQDIIKQIIQYVV